MAKFVIECFDCGKYAEARNGFFAKNVFPVASLRITDLRRRMIDPASEKLINHKGENELWLNL